MAGLGSLRSRVTCWYCGTNRWIEPHRMGRPYRCRCGACVTTSPLNETMEDGRSIGSALYQVREAERTAARHARAQAEDLARQVRRETREALKLVRAAEQAAFRDLRTLARAAQPRAPPLPSKSRIRTPSLGKRSLKATVRKAILEVGPDASLHEVAYRAKVSHSQARRILQTLGARMTATARSGAPGRASTWTLDTGDGSVA